MNNLHLLKNEFLNMNPYHPQLSVLHNCQWWPLDTTGSSCTSRCPFWEGPQSKTPHYYEGAALFILIKVHIYTYYYMFQHIMAFIQLYMGLIKF